MSSDTENKIAQYLHELVTGESKDVYLAYGKLYHSTKMLNLHQLMDLDSLYQRRMEYHASRKENKK
jgi:hypothetical protein